MNAHPTPHIVVSECLGFSACRYNGEILKDKFLERLAAHVEFRPICPEVEIGLGTPRDPVRLVTAGSKLHLMQPATGRDVTGNMHRFSASFLERLTDVDGFILKSRSPSCGTGDVKVYKSMEKGASVGTGAGLFAAAVQEKFPGLAIEDEGRLTNYKIREHFLNRLFALARLREARRERAMRRVVQFHTGHKLLLMAYSQKEMRALGQVVANGERHSVAEVWERYTAHFQQALARMPRHASHVNVLMHAFGYFSPHLASKEKGFYLSTLEKYRMGRIPLSSALSVMKSWMARFEDGYLTQQLYFDPYPEELLELSDSGKGRTQ